MTIYALSSGAGVSGVAIIRISGPETKTVLKSLTKALEHYRLDSIIDWFRPRLGVYN